MQIAQILSGYSLGEADMLRRAMGKKIKAEMDAQRGAFRRWRDRQGGIDKAKANEIFDLLAKFADYGFNKSHAAAYALVAYQTAWFKANYPRRISGRVDDAGQSQHRQAGGIPQRGAPARRQRRAALDPALRRRFRGACGRDGRTLDPLCAFGASRASARARPRRWLSARRQEAVPGFADLAGADQPARNQQAHAGKPRRRGRLRRARAGSRRGPSPPSSRSSPWPTAARRSAAPGRARCSAVGARGAAAHAENSTIWSLAEKLRREFDVSRLFSLRPSARRLRTRAARLRVRALGEFFARRQAGRFGGAARRDRARPAERRTKSGTKMGIVHLSDQSGQYEAILFQEGLNQYRDLLEKGATAAGRRCRPMSRARTCARASRWSKGSTRRRRGSRRAYAFFYATRHRCQCLAKN